MVSTADRNKQEGSDQSYPRCDSKGGSQALQTKPQQRAQLNGMVQTSAELLFKPVVKALCIPAGLR